MTIEAIFHDFNIDDQLFVSLLTQPLEAGELTALVREHKFASADIVYKIDHVVYEFVRSYGHLLRKQEHLKLAKDLALFARKHKIEFEDLLKYIFKDLTFQTEETLLHIDILMQEQPNQFIENIVNVLSGQNRQKIINDLYTKLILYVRSEIYFKELNDDLISYVSRVTEGLIVCLEM